MTSDQVEFIDEEEITIAKVWLGAAITCDGSIGVYGEAHQITITFANTDSKIIHQFGSYLDLLGFGYNIQSIKRQDEKHKALFSLRIKGTQSERVEFLESIRPYLIGRKHDIVDLCIRYEELQARGDIGEWLDVTDGPRTRIETPWHKTFEAETIFGRLRELNLRGPIEN